jgi:hypothetical protein
MAERKFEDTEAKRGKTPLLLGLVAPSGCGKTLSSLRLATGIQRVTGGDIFVLDTEAKRALHYADSFKFRHVPFTAPFSPDDYLAAIEYCMKKGAKIIIGDSFSHEHEGPGGVLEMHAKEVQRLVELYKKAGATEDTVKLGAWNVPKTMRRKMINAITQMEAHFLLNFRAKGKLKIVKGKPPEQRGFMPIAGEELVYEMTARFLLLPGSDGVPLLKSKFSGEQEIIKIPKQFRPIFQTPAQLSEGHGAAMAEWAAGRAVAPLLTVDELLKKYAACSDRETFSGLEASRALGWAKTTKEERPRIKAAVEEAAKRVAAADPEESTGVDGEAPERDAPELDQAETAA